VEQAIRTVAELRAEFPGITLTVVGQGYWEPRLREAAAEHGVDDVVRFAGFVDEDTKHEVLARSWLLAVPSLKEGWGLSVVEAAGHGTPAVAFSGAGGLSESIHDGVTGLLGHSATDFTDKVRQLLRNHALRVAMGDAARQHSHAYTWDAAVDGFQGLLAELTGAAPAAPAARQVPPPLPEALVLDDEPVTGVRV